MKYYKSRYFWSNGQKIRLKRERFCPYFLKDTKNYSIYQTFFNIKKAVLTFKTAFNHNLKILTFIFLRFFYSRKQPNRPILLRCAEVGCI